MAMTQKQAEGLGWSFDTSEDGVVSAENSSGASMRVISDDPLAAALAQIDYLANGDPHQPSPEDAARGQERARQAENIRAALNASDLWVVRHVEDGISLTPARIAYRQELRALLDSVATSTDPDSITIPDLPPPPKP